MLTPLTVGLARGNPSVSHKRSTLDELAETNRPGYPAVKGAHYVKESDPESRTGPRSSFSEKFTIQPRPCLGPGLLLRPQLPGDPAGAHIDQVLGVRSLCLERLAGDVLAAVGDPVLAGILWRGAYRNRTGVNGFAGSGLATS